MTIQNDKVVSFSYNLTDDKGDQLEANEQGIPMSYLHGHKNILRGLEEEMEGLSVGDKKTITLAPEHAYGLRRENAEKRVPIKHLSVQPKRLKPGMLVKVNTDKGNVNARVLKVGKFNIDVDMNHPFAGRTLIFNVEVLDIRDASPEEIAHGHAHGPGGHHH